MLAAAANATATPAPASLMGLRCPLTAGLELTARAIWTRQVRERFGFKTNIQVGHDLPRCAALNSSSLSLLVVVVGPSGTDPAA